MCQNFTIRKSVFNFIERFSYFLKFLRWFEILKVYCATGTSSWAVLFFFTENREFWKQRLFWKVDNETGNWKSTHKANAKISCYDFLLCKKIWWHKVLRQNKQMNTEELTTKNARALFRGFTNIALLFSTLLCFEAFLPEQLAPTNVCKNSISHLFLPAFLAAKEIIVWTFAWLSVNCTAASIWAYGCLSDEIKANLSQFENTVSIAATRLFHSELFAVMCGGIWIWIIYLLSSSRYRY